MVGAVQASNERIALERVDPGTQPELFFGPSRPPEVHKLPFDMYSELPFFDTSYMREPNRRRKTG